MKSHECKHCYTAGILLSLTIIILACCFGFYRTTIIDTHEHIGSMQKAELLHKSNHGHNVSSTFLIPSPIETLTLNGHKSFTGYRENTEEIFRIAETYPYDFIPFCTVNPLDSDALQYLRGCIERGGKGIKLYNGHSYYYDIFGIPLDSPRMDPIYAFAEREKLPILYHVNITKYGDELERVLSEYPNLVVSVPHFMVSSIGLDKVEALLDKYPNLYTDVSFGSPEYMAAGFRRISRNPQKFGNFINRYNDRILFGTDMVLSDSEQKDSDFLDKTLTCYMDLLEERTFECDLVKEYYQKSMEDSKTRYEQCKPKEGDYCESLEANLKSTEERYLEVENLNGLHLSPAVLQNIYRQNPLHFLNANH